jgi:DNA-binding response OmpR family regulator
MADLNYQKSNARADLAGRRILIVEDEAATRQATRRYLQFRGHEVVGAATVDESFEKAKALKPEILICDWKLGDKRDGVEVARELCKRYGVKVIFVTASALPDLRRCIRDLQTVTCMRKPISLATLAAVLDTVDSTLPAPSPDI